MATSQNGWTVLFDAPDFTSDYITGRVAGPPSKTVLDYYCLRYNAQVETIRKEWSWGWAVRPVRGQTSGYSNHASATARDLNAPAHPLGVYGTFEDAQREAMREILDDLDGVLRSGEFYNGRPDGMHVEVDDDYAAVARVAKQIEAGNLPGLKPEWKPKTAKAVHFGRVQEQFLIAAGAQPGKIVRLNGVGVVQQVLNRELGLQLEVDGYCGTATLNAWGRWEDEHGGLGRRRVPDRRSIDELAERTGVRVTAKTWDD